MLDGDKDKVVDKADTDIADFVEVVDKVVVVMVWVDVMVWVVANRQAF
jgi:hypothetical protein